MQPCIQPGSFWWCRSWVPSWSARAQERLELGGPLWLAYDLHCPLHLGIDGHPRLLNSRPECRFRERQVKTLRASCLHGLVVGQARRSDSERCNGAREHYVLLSLSVATHICLSSQYFFRGSVPFIEYSDL